MSFAAAIIGLAVLVLIHEAGHFFAARAVGMTPRKFYLGFGPPLVKRVRGGVEYGIGSIPLGGYVKIPGMSRPEPGLLGTGAQTEAFDAALARGDEETAKAELARLKPELGKTRAWQELDMALAPDAYWRQKTWKRLVAISAGPAVNLLAAVVLFTAVFMVASVVTTNRVHATQAGMPARAAGIRGGDTIVRLAGRPVDGKHLAERLRATEGRPFSVVVIRHGRHVAIGPLRAVQTNGAYRIGIQIEGKVGPGESLPRAAQLAFEEAWFEVRGTVLGLAHIATGRDTQNTSTAVGIVRVSAAAWRDNLHTFFAILGSISLALGLFNLIPVLPLDGGHILIALVEKLRGRTFAQSVYVKYSLVGVGLFAILMYIGLRNDLFGGGG